MVDLSNRRVFLSGPMTGIRHYNAWAFCEAHAALKERGVKTIYNPAIRWLSTPQKRAEEMSHGDWMRVCISELTNGWYDLLVQLPGWHDSEGAKTEFEVAMACGMEVCSITDITDETEEEPKWVRRTIERYVTTLLDGALTPTECVNLLVGLCDG